MQHGLTDRDRAILRALADGHGQESAAANLGIGYQSLKNQLRLMRMKTEMTNYQLVAKIAVEDYKRGLETAPSGVPRD